MRKSRASFTFDPAAPVVRVHCHSAFGGPWPAFTAAERGELVEDIYTLADFAGIELVAFSIGQVSIDLIVDVPRVLKLSKAEMLRRFEATSDPLFFAVEGKKMRAGDTAAWARLASRFGDLGSFIKSVKQRAAHRYHRHRGTSGAVWGSRYTRVFVQPGHTSRVLASWMDHAGVRLGEVDSPGDDRFSTFGRAAAGDERARAMVARLFLPEGGPHTWRTVAKACRDFAAGPSVPTAPPHARKRKGKPLLTRQEFLRVDAPHFRGGVALGDRAFVEAVFELNRAEFGKNRASGARRISGQDDPTLWTIRQKKDLRKLRD